MVERQRVTLRVEAEFLERIDHYCSKMPGAVDRSAGLRMLLDAALSSWENPPEVKPPGPDLASIVEAEHARTLEAIKGLLEEHRQTISTRRGSPKKSTVRRLAPKSQTIGTGATEEWTPEKLKAFRAARGMKQEDLAKAIKRSLSLLASMEQGKKPISQETARRLDALE